MKKNLTNCIEEGKKEFDEKFGSMIEFVILHTGVDERIPAHSFLESFAKTVAENTANEVCDYIEKNSSSTEQIFHGNNAKALTYLVKKEVLEEARKL
jgi:hypothetical protein